MKSRFVLEGSILALMLAAAGCTKPSTNNGTATGGSSGGASGTSTGGQPGASGGSTGSGGAKTSGTGGAVTTGTGGSLTTGTGGSSTTGTGGSTTGATGGSTGAGGTTVGGSGGAGGAAVVKLCATKTVVMNPVFLNFENYTGMGTMTAANYTTAFGGTTPNTGTAYAGLYSYGDGSATPTLSMVGGNPPSNWAAGLTVTQASSWGMSLAVWMGCANASAYKGISFYARGSSGTGMFSFNVSMESTQLPDATNPAGGGTCPGTSDTCKDPSKANIPLTTDWTQVQILWADFTPGVSGATSVVPNGDNIAGLVWSVPLQYHLDPSVPADAAGPYIPIPSDLLIQIDDISFIQ